MACPHIGDKMSSEPVKTLFADGHMRQLASTSWYCQSKPRSSYRLRMVFSFYPEPFVRYSNQIDRLFIHPLRPSDANMRR